MFEDRGWGGPPTLWVSAGEVAYLGAIEAEVAAERAVSGVPEETVVEDEAVLEGLHRSGGLYVSEDAATGDGAGEHGEGPGPVEGCEGPSRVGWVRVPEAGELAGRVPGPRLACELTGIDPGAVGDDVRLELVAAWSRVASWAQGQAALTAGVYAKGRPVITATSPGAGDPAARGRRRVRPISVAAPEIALRLALSHQGAQKLITLGRLMSGALIPVGDALLDGEIDLPRARVFAEALGQVPWPVAVDVQDVVLPTAGRRTVTQVAKDVAAALIAVDPAEASARHQRARESRRVCRPRVLPEGMAGLYAVLPAADAVALDVALDAAARAARADGDSRTTDQLRADALATTAYHSLATGRLTPILAPHTPCAPGPTSEGGDASGSGDHASVSADDEQEGVAGSGECPGEGSAATSAGAGGRDGAGAEGISADASAGPAEVCAPPDLAEPVAPVADPVDPSTPEGTVGPGAPSEGTVGPGAPSEGTVGPGAPSEGTVGPGAPSEGTVGPGAPSEGTVGPGAPSEGTVGPGAPSEGTVGPGVEGAGSSTEPVTESTDFAEAAREASVCVVPRVPEGGFRLGRIGGRIPHIQVMVPISVLIGQDDPVPGTECGDFAGQTTTPATGITGSAGETISSATGITGSAGETTSSGADTTAGVDPDDSSVPNDGHGSPVPAEGPAGGLRGLLTRVAVLGGYGPISPDQARLIAADATWQRILTDPVTGMVRDLGQRTYRPPQALADLVRARDRTCVRPGCAVAAIRCDLDHTIPYHLGGPTAEGNLGPFCTTDHVLKTHGAFRVVQSSPGTFEFRLPTGHVYTRHPDGTVTHQYRHPARTDGHEPGDTDAR